VTPQVLAQLIAALGPEPADSPKQRRPAPIADAPMPDIQPVADVPLTGLAAQKATTGDFINTHAKQILPLLGLAALIAAMRGGKKKAEPAAGRTAQAGSLERGRSLTIPRQKGGLELGLNAAAQIAQAYAQAKQAEQATALTAQKAAADYRTKIALAVANGEISPEMGQAMIVANQTGGTAPMGIGPNAAYTNMERAARATKDMREPKETESSLVQRASGVAMDQTQPIETRRAAAAFVAANTNQNFSGSGPAFSGAQQPRFNPNTGAGGDGRRSITPNAEMALVRDMGVVLGINFSPDDPKIIELAKMGKKKFDGMDPAGKLSMIRTYNAVASNAALFDPDQARGQTFIRDFMGQAAEGLAGASTGPAPSPGTATLAQEMTAEVLANADAARKSMTREELDASYAAKTGEDPAMDAEWQAALDSVFGAGK